MAKINIFIKKKHYILIKNKVKAQKLSNIIKYI